MLVPFESLPEEARIWVYQSNRPFTGDELEQIRKDLERFLTQWTAHGSDLNAGFELPYNRFIVIGLDQSQASASGCSIDASVHFLQSLESEYGVNLLDRMNVTYKQGPYIAYKPLDEFKKMAKARSVSGKTIVFNNLVANKHEYTENWEIPASESWHSRFF
ncbi:ABC transporter ATPase [Robiginitalea aurantiaca]|uniref:ABC transporter ATPase n=1 Tax=Robiginitalea aurantiaca TaxID=3056915 RepID=A0ABT7WI37_9FLAO|nr:ABC transporter ATPase [Robiginitalea aurantiaca]MDM9632572.1 ABC transporter ATPase [Robiginitalea aurantiaca]